MGDDHPVRVNAGIVNAAGRHIDVGAVCDVCRATWRMGETSDGVSMELDEFREHHRHE